MLFLHAKIHLLNFALTNSKIPHDIAIDSLVSMENFLVETKFPSQIHHSILHVFSYAIIAADDIGHRMLCLYLYLLNFL